PHAPCQPISCSAAFNPCSLQLSSRLRHEARSPRVLSSATRTDSRRGPASRERPLLPLLLASPIGRLSQSTFACGVSLAGRNPSARLAHASFIPSSDEATF